MILRCGATFLQSCPHPNQVKVTVTCSRFSESVQTQLSDNRLKRGTELDKLTGSVFRDLPLHSATLEESILTLIQALHSVNPSTERFTLLADTGLALFYHVVTNFSPTVLLCPISQLIYSRCLELLGPQFIKGHAQQQEPLLDLILKRPNLANLLVPHFSPQCLNGTQFFEVYQSVCNGLKTEKLKDDVALALLGKVSHPFIPSSILPSILPFILSFNN